MKIRILAMSLALLSSTAAHLNGQDQIVQNDNHPSPIQATILTVQDEDQSKSPSDLTSPGDTAVQDSIAPATERAVLGPCEPWIVTRQPLFDCGMDSPISIEGCIGGNKFDMPMTFGAYHWFHQSLISQSGGYGIADLRNTYFWYVNADPRIDLGNQRAVGAHLEYRFRETGTFRSFIDDKVWPWEAYGYYENACGKLKAGLLFKEFGLAWDGAFFGNAHFFDGMKQDADYGISWEATHRIHDGFNIHTYSQFFFHEDQSNGSFAGADPESIAGYTERNTSVFRIAPTWTTCDRGQVELGFSALYGDLNSTRFDLPDDDASAYAVDLTYTHGHWKTMFEASHRYGMFHPVNYISGGPSNNFTNYLAGIQYTVGPATYRCSFTNTIAENPNAKQNMVVAGITYAVSKNVDLYLEYVNQRIDDAQNPGQNGELFNSLEYVINWHF